MTGVSIYNTNMQHHFEIKETNVQHADGHISVNKTPKVTGKGQQYFINKFLSEDEVAG